ncbi:MAG TPA: YaiO family outer membrane beta-barrel protein [Chitinophaga sp.]|uniref:YaiO family outer membrane beta-barrel protein n=1 Tax=Chitinophaga sp. TaxID=1869181 RepID=UPI002CC30288|nr:YaiO family outer membrane beta-barrel protein [Chitinophaga sp.]HVI45751.1 YaiO family outer membrane beta-barrel protein [Chitinophaga sp.]
MVYWKNIIQVFFLFACLFYASGVAAQRKGLVSSDVLLQRALEETNQRHDYEKAKALCLKALKQSPGYTDVMLLLGRLYVLTGDTHAGRIQWQLVLRKEPKNMDALQYLINLEYNQGRSGEAVCYVDMALAADPDNKDLLMKKYGILQENRLKTEQEKVLAKLSTLFPNDEKVKGIKAEYLAAGKKEEANNTPQPEETPVRKPDSRTIEKDRLTNAYLAARKRGDKAQQITLSRQLLELEPGNKSALNAVINTYYSMQHYNDALQWCNAALMQYPSDADFVLKKTGILQDMRQYDAAAVSAACLLKVQPNQRNRQIYYDIQRQRINDFSKAGNGDSALSVINVLLQQAPGDTTLLFKKSALLEAAGQYTEAATLSRALMTQYPAITKYKQAYTDQLMTAARRELSGATPAKAQPLLQEVVHTDPHNQDAWLSLINLQNRNGATTAATQYCDSALSALGNNTIILQKKSALLQQSHNYPAAYAISGQLLQQHPADTTLRSMYTDQLMSHGKQLRDANAWDSALTVYRMAYAYNPADTLLLQSLANMHLALKQYDSSLVYTNKGLQLYPQDKALLMKKAETLETLKRYREAAATAGSLKHLDPGNSNIRNYHAWLQSKTYRNQVGVIHLQSIFDNGSRPGSITSLQYLRFHNRGSIGGRINYADRAGGNGVQLEAETYYTHNKSNYSYGLVSWSNADVFPRFRAGYSLFHNFGKEWEGELGARYLRADSVDTWSGVWSVAKYWNNYWVNLRGYVINERGKWFQAYTLTNRYYLNDQKDFVALMLSLGTTPDDRSRNYQFAKAVDFFSSGIGAGYQKTFNYRTTLGLFGNWTNQHIGNGQSYNQYDIYLTLLYNF